MLIIITGVLAYILGGLCWQNRFWRASRKERKAWCEEQSSLSPPPQEARRRSTGERVKRFRCKHCRCAGLFAWLLLLFLTPWPLWPPPPPPPPRTTDGVEPEKQPPDHQSHITFCNQILIRCLASSWFNPKWAIPSKSSHINSSLIPQYFSNKNSSH